MTDTTAQTIKTGDILTSSWGYDQTNVDYYFVVKATKKTVTVRRMESITRPDGPQTFTGHAVPYFVIKGDKIEPVFHRSSEPMRRKLHVYNSGSFVKITDYQYAYLWDKTAQRTSSYA